MDHYVGPGVHMSDDIIWVSPDYYEIDYETFPQGQSLEFFY